MTLQEYMLKAAVPKYMDGCEYLELAIQYKIDEPRKTMGSIYMDIGKKYGLSWYAIEASIRRAILKSYDGMDDSIKSVFGCDDNKIPSNAVYIESVAYSLRKGII